MKGTSKAANFIPQTKTIFLKQVQNDLEAIIMEANYIKSYLPKYNSASKDNKSNVYIIFTNYPDTKIKVVHATDIRTLDLDNYKKQVFGPYTSTKVANLLVKESRRIFGYCLAPFNGRNRACFYYHLNKCPGACKSEISVKQYQIHLGKIKKFLSGKFKSLQKSLVAQINKQAKKENFEKANQLKQQLESLNQAVFNPRSSMLLMLSDANDQLLPLIVKKLSHPKLHTPPQRIECYDLAHLQGENYVGSMSVFINCTPSTKDYRHFKIAAPDRSDPYAMRQIVSRRLTHQEWVKPDLIVLDGGLPQLSIVSPVIPTDIPVIALAKKKETLIFMDENNKAKHLNLDLDDPVLNLFRSLRDEAHRFANTYHGRLKTQKIKA